KKDGWDKAGVLAQFLAGTVIGFASLIIGASVQKGQRVDTERQQFSTYLKNIVEAPDEEKRAQYISQLDLALTARADVINVASTYALAANSSDPVREQAIIVLGKYPKETKPTLQEIANAHRSPDKELAQAIL